MVPPDIVIEAVPYANTPLAPMPLVFTVQLERLMVLLSFANTPAFCPRKLLLSGEEVFPVVVMVEFERVKTPAFVTRTPEC